MGSGRSKKLFLGFVTMKKTRMFVTNSRPAHEPRTEQFLGTNLTQKIAILTIFTSFHQKTDQKFGISAKFWFD